MTDKESIRKKLEHIIQRRLNLLNGEEFDLWLETKGFTNEIVDTIIDFLQEDTSFHCGDCIKWKDGKGCTIESENTHCITDTACSKGVEKSKQEKPVDVDTQIKSQNDAIKNLNSALNNMEHNGHLPVIEEPVSEDLEKELYSYIKSNFTIDKEQLEKFGIKEKDYMYSMDESDILKMIRHFTNNYKVPASNDLEEAAKLCVSDSLRITNEEDWDDAAVDALDIFKAGANWQKEQDKETIELAEDHAMLAGMEKMKEEMMKDAIEQDVDSIWANPINTLERLGLHNFKGKVKLIVIK